MKELLEKISSYNIFTNLFPGILFSILSQYFTNFSFIQSNIAIDLFFYYFIGLILSRIGSLVVEPLLKKLSIIKFLDYKLYIDASKKDPFILTLSETNNTYRTLISLFLTLFLLKLFSYLTNEFPGLKEYQSAVANAVIIILLTLSFKKQTDYISKRINN